MFPEAAQALFERIRQAGGGEDNIKDHTLNPQSREDLSKTLIVCSFEAAYYI